jgi:hypothetical protein
MMWIFICITRYAWVYIGWLGAHALQFPSTTLLGGKFATCRNDSIAITIHLLALCAVLLTWFC